VSCSVVVASCTHEETCETTGFSARFGSPNVTAIAYSTTKPSRKWVNGPVAITTVRFHVFCRHMARGSSSGATSSSAVIPAISQNPPTGMALSPYSVSPRRNDQMRGPMPMKYLRTFMPNAFAVSRWPASCRASDAPTHNAKSTTPMMYASTPAPLTCRSGEPTQGE
jgi:hypothetical protein